MTKRDGIPKTDPSGIAALIQRLKQSNLEPLDAQLVERLLHIVLSITSLLCGVSVRACPKRLCGVSGHCPRRRPAKHPVFNTVIFGAVIAVAYCNLVGGTLRRVGLVG
jgi:hypothetical protein